MIDNKNTQIFQGIVIGLLITIVFFLIFNTLNSKQNTISIDSNSSVDKSTISVSGNYETNIQPDQSELLITITSKDKDSIKAQTDNTDVTTRVINALKDKGLNKDNIETLNYRIELLREWDPNTQGYKEDGIQVINSIKVTIKDLTKISSIIDAATHVESTPITIISIDNLAFTLSKDKQRQLNEELLAKASKNAKKKANSIADSLGVSIIRVISVSEGSVYTPYYFERTMLASAELKTTPINPSLVSANANVNIVFEIN